MRIVGGRHRGRKLEAPEGQSTRPTSDRARESLFNILAHGKFAAGGSPFIGAGVLDVFAGTGALGLEALSRGAASVVFIENDAAALRALTANIGQLGEGARTQILKIDAVKPPECRGTPARLVLLDPPYGKELGGKALAALDQAGWLAADALAVLEVARDEAFAAPEGFEIADERVYGAARLIFIRRIK